MRAWTDSRTVKYLVLTFLGTVLLQLVPMLQAHEVDWWALGAQAVGTLAAVLIRMAQDDIEAPVSMLNMRNPKQ
jgi:hypothetical protein